MQTVHSYDVAWREYRRVRLTAIVSLLGFLPFLGCVTILFERMHWNEYVGFAFDAAYLLWMSFSNIRYALWPCPRCGKAYRGLRPYTGNQCFYCRLPKWADSQNTS